MFYFYCIFPPHISTECAGSFCPFISGKAVVIGLKVMMILFSIFVFWKLDFKDERTIIGWRGEYFLQEQDQGKIRKKLRFLTTEGDGGCWILRVVGTCYSLLFLEAPHEVAGFQLWAAFENAGPNTWNYGHWKDFYAHIRGKKSNRDD